MDSKNKIAAPVSQAERISSLDTLRGFAVLGILLMNIQSFAMIGMALYRMNILSAARSTNLFAVGMGNRVSEYPVFATKSVY